MIDIIIPSYNNELGLYNTLMSLGTINYGQQVYIIDDASQDKIDYNRIQQTFNQFYPIFFIQSPINVGPGGIRQFGIELAKSNIITFIDCGDTVIFPSLIQYINTLFDENSDLQVVSCAHAQEMTTGDIMIVDASHNRMHGKFYRKSFLQENNINFNIACSRCNEDIGFNRQCRLTCELLNQKYLELKEIFINWKLEENSITRINNYDFYYNIQIQGLITNIEYCIQNMQDKFNVNLDFFAKLICEIFIHMYIVYVQCATDHPEYKEKNFFLIQQFYKKYENLLKINQQILLEIYDQNMAAAYINSESWIHYPQLITLFNFIQQLQGE